MLNFVYQLCKNASMKNWDDRRFFLAVAREGSLNKAAEKLSVNRSTVLRRITAFEKELGVRLFERLPNGYFTTAAGEEMMRAAERMEDAVNDADRVLAGRDAKLCGTIRVSVSGALATYVLMPDITAFNQAHPEIRLEILTTFDMPDLARREADVAIRISNDPPDDLVGRRVVKVARAAYVGKQNLPHVKNSAPGLPLSWIGWSLEPSSRQLFEESNYSDLPVDTIISDPYTTVRALRCGMGMSILPCFMGDSEPELYRMPPGNLLIQTDLWVLTHQDLRNAARIQIFTNFLVEALSRQRDLLEGRCPQALPSA